MNNLILSFIVFAAYPASAEVYSPKDVKNPKYLACQRAMLEDSERLTKDRQAFFEFIGYFRDLGLNQLTNLVDAKKVDVTSLLSNAAECPRVWVAPPGRRGGNPQIQFTHLRYHTPRRLEEVRWGIARALFEVELNARLADKPPRLNGTNARERSRQVADYRLRQVNALLKDLYTVIDNIEQLDPSELLPKKDPGRPWMPLLALVKGGPRKLGPNAHDFKNYWRGAGEDALKTEIGDRYDRTMVYAAYREQARFLVNLGLTGGAFMLLGSAVAVPYADVSNYLFPTKPVPEVNESQFNQEEPVRESDLTPEQKRAVENKLRAMEDELVKLSNASFLNVPTQKIEDLKNRIRNLKMKFTFLMMINEQQQQQPHPR